MALVSQRPAWSRAQGVNADTRLLIMHGTDDSLISPVYSELIVGTLRLLGMDVDMYASNAVLPPVSSRLHQHGSLFRALWLLCLTIPYVALTVALTD